MRTAVVSLIVSVAFLAGPRLHAAINLLGASDATVEFGDALGTGNPTAFTVAFTWRSAASISGSLRMAGQWSGAIGGSQQAWLVQTMSATNFGCIVHGGALSYHGKQTTDNPLATTTTHRIVCTWQTGTPNTMRIWVNGVESTTSTFVGAADLSSMHDSVAETFLGREDDESVDGEDGDYSEFALWTTAVPAHVVAAYSAGISPHFFRPGGVFYAPLANHTDLRNLWGGTSGTNTAGTSSAHPSMYRPVGQ